VIGPNNPGIGEYDISHLKTIANKEFQGGASNNFVLFSRKNFQLRAPNCPESPRLHKLLETTPRDIGPGSYLGKKPKTFRNNTGAQTMTNNLHFGIDTRFKFDA